ncbi:hydroxymethylpyrimidine pyrophosphatase-like HAD family hydrolase [Tumebacillus sp. BK434]|uniref:HAD family hydrolase n=1 Tax=Tumebacillus sp. BK434 TaxID=2512169 RepID=UPI0010482613|nr:HAD family hydrolase [Tumebacillus sp. BK434]TCP57928.1 hydroxymethylpyrimidine pyrophosphatase-like HAD family hydrolase [Tumebacillus sp. BK434]
MIFASDLDQTLIYSQRSLGGASDSCELIPVELRDGTPFSYMPKQALELLREVAERAAFVPVTTRTVEQYRRIHLFQEQILPKYAVTSNGGNILFDGEPDPEWNRHLHRLIRETCLPAREAYAVFQAIASPQWVLGERFCDEMYYAIIIRRELMPTDEVMLVAERLKASGWELSVQGRKLYLVPHAVSKRAALAHLEELSGKEVRLASGDSLLDRGMLDFARHAIIPRHGELYREQAEYRMTRDAGVSAAVEILLLAAELCS